MAILESDQTWGNLRVIKAISVFWVNKELTQKWLWFLKIGPMDYLPTKFLVDILTTSYRKPPYFFGTEMVIFWGYLAVN